MTKGNMCSLLVFRFNSSFLLFFSLIKRIFILSRHKQHGYLCRFYVSYIRTSFLCFSHTKITRNFMNDTNSVLIMIFISIEFHFFRHLHGIAFKIVYFNQFCRKRSKCDFLNKLNNCFPLNIHIIRLNIIQQFRVLIIIHIHIILYMSSITLFTLNNILHYRRRRYNDLYFLLIL